MGLCVSRDVPALVVAGTSWLLSVVNSVFMWVSEAANFGLFFFAKCGLHILLYTDHLEQTLHTGAFANYLNDVLTLAALELEGQLIAGVLR